MGGLGVQGVGLGDACGAGFGQGGVQLIQDVLVQHIVIELRRSLAVKQEPPHFADSLAAPGLVSIVLGPRRTELQGWTGLTGTVHKHHRIGVKVEDLFSQQLQGLVEAEPHPTGGEAGHEDVQVGRQGLAVVLFGIVDFHTVFGQGADIPDIILVAVQELVEGLGLSKFPDLHLVVALAKLGIYLR